MVAAKSIARRKGQRSSGLSSSAWIGIILVGSVSLMLLTTIWVSLGVSSVSTTTTQETKNEESSLRKPEAPPELPKQQQDNAVVEETEDSEQSCPFNSMTDLTDEERYPKASKYRHIVDPPKGGNVTLVCCTTTKGPWNIVVHDNWSPLGARRFLNMVEDGYFNAIVPLMRCVKGFLCQFGLNGKASNKYRSMLKDETNWLPGGPAHRSNELGVKRFQQGYFSYAGAGPNTRSNQIFVALQDNPILAGGSPWEVVFGELVGAHSFNTLRSIYTGYGEKGPSQGFLHSHDSSAPELKKDFPLLDYVTSCKVVDHEIQTT